MNFWRHNQILVSKTYKKCVILSKASKKYFKVFGAKIQKGTKSLLRWLFLLKIIFRVIFLPVCTFCVPKEN